MLPPLKRRLIHLALACAPLALLPVASAQPAAEPIEEGQGVGLLEQAAEGDEGGTAECGKGFGGLVGVWGDGG